MSGSAQNDELVAELRKLLGERDAEIAAERKRVAELTERIGILEGKLRALQRHLYGRSSERFVDHPELPFPGDEPEPETPDFAKEAPDDEEQDTDAKGRERRKRGVTKIPADLPRVREEIEVPAEERTGACGCALVRIGEKITEIVEYEPGSFFIREIARGKYACREHEESGVTTPEIPPRPIPKGMAGPSLLAQVVTAKYKDHLPLHRQHGIYLRHGVEIAESTMVDWIRGVAEIADPVIQAMERSILSRDIVASDDTTICVLDPSHPKGSRSAYLWAYLGEPGETVFRFTNGRGRDSPKNFFGDYKGYIQADAYAGYEELFKDPGRLHAGCWAHARRNYFESLDTAEDHAKHAIAAIRLLYDVERQADKAELVPEARRELRIQQSKPVLDDLHAWLQALQGHVLPKSRIGKALGYTLRQWRALTRILDDGRLKLDNNRCERAIRQVAIGRKNWMFAGSEAGGHRAAALYSLIGGCIELKVDPFTYLRDMLDRLARGESPEQLTPLAWSTARG